MEDKENSGGAFDRTYNKLICQEDFSTDEHFLYSNKEQQQVSMSMVRAESSLNHYRVLAVSLAVLAVVLLAVDIGLGVYYSKLTITDINSELAKLQATYNTTTQSKEEVRKQMARKISERQRTKYEIEHQIRRSKDYEELTNKIQKQIAVLNYHIPMMEEGCRQGCLPGWTFMNSACYFFALSQEISLRSWSRARWFCQRLGGDLAKIDTREKHLAVSEMINTYYDPSLFSEEEDTGFWIGLSDQKEEGNWKWPDETELTEGYWKNGAPINYGFEDCVATYHGKPYMAWDDIACHHDLRWICEMAPSHSRELHQLSCSVLLNRPCNF
uniref:C-type lectin domain-containing protein n=1 Tax=Lates calcarifer TaxID=8187 RepID=A0A4W6EZ30_LATCA